MTATLTPLLAWIGLPGGVLRAGGAAMGWANVGWPNLSAAYLFFAPESGFRHYLRMQYEDQTFKGLYHWNLFDAAVLLPYFAVMILLFAVWNPPLYDGLPLLQVPQKLQTESAAAL
ncbi:MAG: hypothetical protein WDM87_07395 [Terracidiphilus sp.]